MFHNTVAGEVVILVNNVDGATRPVKVDRTTDSRLFVRIGGNEVKFNRTNGKQYGGSSAFQLQVRPEAGTVKNAARLNDKSKGHQVEQVTEHTYRVTSGTSGNQYVVSYLPGESVTCTCPWGILRRSGVDSGCSHRIAVERFLAKAAGYSGLIAVREDDDVTRLHRKAFGGGDGIKFLAHR